MMLLGMHPLALAVQVTALACLACVLAAWTGQRDSRATVILVTGTLALFVILPLLDFCPVPDYCRWSLYHSMHVDQEAIKNTPAAGDSSPLQNQQGLPLASVLAWLHRFMNEASEPSGHAGTWDVLAFIYTFGLIVGGTRLAAGWLAIQALRRRCQAIADADLLLLAQELSAGVGCSRAVSLMECPEPGLAATVGWWRPVVLLPAGWRNWTQAERRAVLAHEMAHVVHRDYLIGIFTRCSLALYFYHPLVRWLARQIRWHQEMAADALAARAVGGSGTYVKALAQLALRLPARKPSRAFPLLPAVTGGILMRRIRVLRETRRALDRRVPRVLLGVLACAGLVIASAHGPASPPPATANTSQIEPFELGYLAPESKNFIALRPSAWFQQPGMDKIADKLNSGIVKTLKMFQETGVLPNVVWPDALKVQNIEQIVADLTIFSRGPLVALEGNEKPSRSLIVGSSSMFIRLNKEFDWVGFLRSADPGMTEIHKGDVTLYKLGPVPFLGALSVYCYVPDKRSLVVCGWAPDSQAKTAEEIIPELAKNVAVARRRGWCSGWALIKEAALTIVMEDSKQNLPNLPEVQELLDDVRCLGLAVEPASGVRVRLLIDAKSAEAASTMKKTLRRHRQTLQEMLPSLAQAAAKDDKMELQLASDLLQSLQIDQEGSRLECHGRSSLRLPDLFEAADK
jgi:Zn-dependent protease with chaperone function